MVSALYITSYLTNNEHQVIDNVQIEKYRDLF